MALEVTASVLQISPERILSDGYELSDQVIIPNSNIPSTFSPFPTQRGD